MSPRVIRFRAKRTVDFDCCEMEGCDELPSWQIDNDVNHRRMSCLDHLNHLVEPGVRNTLTPIKRKAVAVPFYVNPLRTLAQMVA